MEIFPILLMDRFAFVQTQDSTALLHTLARMDSNLMDRECEDVKQMENGLDQSHLAHVSK